MGENICTKYNIYGVDIQDVKSTHKIQQKKKDPIHKSDKKMNRDEPKEDIELAKRPIKMLTINYD